MYRKAPTQRVHAVSFYIITSQSDLNFCQNLYKATAPCPQSRGCVEIGDVLTCAVQSRGVIVDPAKAFSSVA